MLNFTRKFLSEHPIALSNQGHKDILQVSEQDFVSRVVFCHLKQDKVSLSGTYHRGVSNAA